MTKILVVEDDDVIREVVLEYLADAGFETFAATDAKAAHQIMDREPELDLLLVDFNLGGALDGVDIADDFRAAYPEARVLMMSGRPDLARSKLLGRERTGLLSKPFHVSDLLLAIEKTLPATH
jgi:DNA-binding response OmpR family regulator